MNPGAWLVGLAAALATVTYIARPFRKVLALDQEIEAWVAALGADRVEGGPRELEVPALPDEPIGRGVSDVAFCYRCGRSVKPHHRFCPRCGAGLGEDEV
jgi:hypothetical protein